MADHHVMRKLGNMSATALALAILGGVSASAQSSPPKSIPENRASSSSALAERAFARKIEWQQSREPRNYRDFSQLFVEIFNSDDLERLLAHVAPSLLERTSGDQLIGFLRFLKTDNGPIKVLRFKYFDRENQRDSASELAVYFLEFGNGSQWAFRLGLDEERRMTRNIITDNNFIEDLPLIAARTNLRLPFSEGEEWYVLWGGESEEQNYHVVSRSQKNAFDFLIKHPWSKRTFRTDGRVNEDYFAFGKPVQAPADGEIVRVIDGVEDNEPGKMNARQLTGNTVVIRSAAGEYVLLAHLQKNSVAVREGQRVAAGNLIGRVGNSGNSSEPHLHLQVMDLPTMREATGLKAYFEKVVVNGDATATHYSPVRGNTVRYPE